MKRILIPIFYRDTNLWTIVHGSQLVERIDGKIYILEYIQENKEDVYTKPTDNIVARGKDLINHKTKEENYVHIKVRKNFLKTCIDFIVQEKIDLLLLSIPNNSSHLKETIELIRIVKGRNLCNVKLVKK